MRYCERCVTPSSHPRSRLADDSPVCSSCLAHDARAEIDWAARRAAFERVVDRAKGEQRGYDCLIPVSGGKDSFWQVITCLAYGLNPLTVTWRDPARLPIGQENLDTLVRLGVDHIDFWINPKVEQIFLRKSVERYGVPGIPKHMALYNIPLRMAVKFNVPLVVWGENAAIEYGDIDANEEGFEVDYAWLSRHGVTQGTTAEDWIDDELSACDLQPYCAPTRQELEASPVRAVYLGYYFPWDPVETYKAARAHGFVAPETGPGYYNFDDVDSRFISIHHYIKWFKFGCTRLFDNLSIEIRNGRIARDKAIAVIAARGSERPHEDIRAFCDYLGFSEARFMEMLEGFRNPDIWARVDGTWQMPDFIVPDWDGWADVNRA